MPRRGRLRRLGRAFRGALGPVRRLLRLTGLSERFLQAAVERVALHLQHLFEAPLDVLERGTQVVLIEHGAALLAKLLDVAYVTGVEIQRKTAEGKTITVPGVLAVERATAMEQAAHAAAKLGDRSLLPALNKLGRCPNKTVQLADQTAAAVLGGRARLNGRRNPLMHYSGTGRPGMTSRRVTIRSAMPNLCFAR